MDTLPPPHVGDDLASSPVERVAAVVALKTLPAAKSRMSSLPDALRERLARCMALDTLSALAPAVDQVLVVSDQPDLPAALLRADLPIRVIAEPSDPGTAGDLAHGGGSLNRALAHGDDRLRRDGIEVVLACVGDLPALRTTSVRRVIAASHRPATVLPRRPRRPRDHDADCPRRTPESVVRKGDLVRPNDRLGEPTSTVGGPGPGPRRGARRPLGCGHVGRSPVRRISSARVRRPPLLLDPSSGAPGRYLALEVVGRQQESFTVLADGFAESVPERAYDGDPALLVPGRRVHAVRVAGALRCWA